jgi:hypothetical protein
MLRSLALSLCLCASVALAQDTTRTAASSGTLSVYLDCQTFGCDFDYFRTELSTVNWVRDRAVADLHLLVTSEQTGSGGRRFTVAFLGLRQFAGMADTLTWSSPPASTEDDVRKGLLGLFRLGFVRYVARTPAAARVTVTFGADTGKATQTTTKKDPWKAWVFSLSANGFGFGEEKYKDYNSYNYIEANRVTAQWKTNVSAGFDYSENRNTYPVCTGTPSVCRDTTDINIRKGDNASALVVRSLGSHLSAGMRFVTFSSTYENYHRVMRFLPALEYDFFPYSQSTRQQITLEYNVGYARFAYVDTTAFDKKQESMPLQRLGLNVQTRQPWGSIDVGSSAIHYFDDRDLYRLRFNGGFELKVVKGLRVRADGNYEKIQDQFNLRKADLTPEEILTRQFQLGTGFRFWGSFGLEYTFGSIYNNVVNPRMARGGF